MSRATATNIATWFSIFFAVLIVCHGLVHAGRKDPVGHVPAYGAVRGIAGPTGQSLSCVRPHHLETEPHGTVS